MDSNQSGFTQKQLSEIKALPNLTQKTRDQLSNTDSFSKSKAINNLYQIQDKVINDAKKTGDPNKIREANRFAGALERETKFLRFSK